MSHKLSLLSLIACTLLIGACSHYDMPAAADLDQRLETQLTNNGIKQFSFTIERIRAPGMEGRHSRASFANGRKKYKNPAQRNRDLKDFAQTLLAAKMLASGYCTSGYILYEELLSVGNYKSRGECNEGAGTDSDKLVSG